VTHRIQLPALVGSHPLAALASFGLLRLITDRDETAKLGFTMEDDWVAFIEVQRFDSIDAILDEAVAWIRSDGLDTILRWTGDDVRVLPSEYRSALRNSLAENNVSLASFLTAFAADGAVDGQKGQIKPSAFYMVSGQQSFLNCLREILIRVRSDAASAFRETLVGPWSYQTSLHSLGWDPNTERLYALRHRSPTSEKPTCVAGAVLLALWALPLFPTLSAAGRAYTIGFTSKDRLQYLSWPVFSKAIDLRELRSLLHAGENGWSSASGRLRPGIETIFRSRRFEFGQGYAVLRGAEAIYRQRDDRRGNFAAG
jgi:hypothetical protein